MENKHLWTAASLAAAAGKVARLKANDSTEVELLDADAAYAPLAKMLAATDGQRIVGWDGPSRESAATPGDMDSGQTWVQVAGSWDVVGLGHWQTLRNASGGLSLLSVDWGVRTEVSATVVVGDVNDAGGLCCLLADADNFVACRLTGTNGRTAEIVQMLDGVQTVVATATANHQGRGNFTRQQLRVARLGSSRRVQASLGGVFLEAGVNAALHDNHGAGLYGVTSGRYFDVAVRHNSI